jgi:chitodextrinase
MTTTSTRTPDDLPATTTPPHRYRGLGVLALAAGVVVSVTACGSLAASLAERSDGHTKAFEYATGAQGKADDALPSWVPDDAADVRGVFRTTGDEAILTMTADEADLPACDAVTATAPLAPRPERGDLRPEDYRTDSTLKASWWTAGQEGEATRMCGAWWVGAQDGEIFAFTPELTAVEIEDQPDPA